MNLDCATEEYGARYRGTFLSLDGNASSNDVTGHEVVVMQWIDPDLIFRQNIGMVCHPHGNCTCWKRTQEELLNFEIVQQGQHWSTETITLDTGGQWSFAKKVWQPM